MSETRKRTWANVNRWLKDYRPSWQTVGFVAVAAVTGGVASALALKGALALNALLTAQTAIKTAMMTNALSVPITTIGTVGGGAAGLGLRRQQAQASQSSSSTSVAPIATEATWTDESHPPTAESFLSESLPEVMPVTVELQPVVAQPVMLDSIVPAMVDPDQVETPQFDISQMLPVADLVVIDLVATDVVTTSVDDLSLSALILDRFEMIEGFVPAYVYKMNRAGILTYQDLAAQSPAALCALLDDDDSNETICARWIQRAQGKVHDQSLSPGLLA